MHIVIIGAGIAGLALAVSLQKLLIAADGAPSMSGVSFTVYERDEHIDCRPQGYSLTLQRNGMQVLNRLGLKSQIEQLECRCASNYTYDSDGSVLVAFDPRLGNKKSKNIPIPRQLLRKMLYEQLDDREHLVVWNKDFKRYETIVSSSGEENATTSIKVHFEDGDTVLADLVVACDGIRSKVRAQMLPQVELNYLGVWTVNGISHWGGSTSTAADTDSTTESEFKDRVFQTIDGKSRVFVKPYLPGVSMWQITFPFSADQIDEMFHQSKQYVIDRVRQEISEWKHQMVTDLIDHTPLELVRSAPLFDLNPLSTWTTNRVTLIGDSCHPMSPFKGQGANNALVDVMSLVDALHRVLMKLQTSNEVPSDSLLLGELSHFEQEMLQRTKGTVLASRRAVQFYHSGACMDQSNLFRFLGVKQANDTGANE